MVLHGTLRSWTLRAATAAVVAGLLAAACHRVPLVAPSGSSLTLLVSTNVLPVNGSADLTAILLEGSASGDSGVGTPVHDGTLVTFSTSIGRVDPTEARTTNGRVTVKLVGDGRSGTAKVVAYSGAATSTLDVDIGAAGATRIALTANPQALPPTGGSTSISARVEDQQGNGISGVPVSFSTTKGSLSGTTVVTNDAGLAQTTLTTVAEATVSAGAGGAAAAITGTVVVTLNAAPTITVTAPASATLGVPAVFTVTPGTNTFVAKVTLDFGDGSGILDMGRVTAATTVSHFFRRSGELTVTARVTDGEGVTTPVSTRVGVLPLSATIAILPAPTATTPKVGDTLTFVVTPSVSTSVDHIDWDFGDGTSQSTQGLTIAHAYGSVGTKVVTANVYPNESNQPRQLLLTLDVKP